MRILGFCLTLLISYTLQAETKYITDHVRFHLLEEPDRKAKRIGTVASGAKITVVESEVEGKFSKVTTEDGKTGYIEARRLVGKTMAKKQLDTVKRELAALKAASKKTTKPKKPNAESKALKKALNKKTAELRSLQQELESLRRLSRNELRIAQDRNKLHQKVERLTRNNDELRQQLDNADSSNNQWWLLSGGIVLLLGLALGLLLPHINSKRQNTYLSGYK